MQKYFLVFIAGVLITLLGIFGFNKLNGNKISKPPIDITDQLPEPIGIGCYVQGCHGLDIQCGSSQVEACDEMYQLGDGCRQLAKCGVINTKCEPVLDKAFVSCRTCVQNCELKYVNDPASASECESSCYQ